MRYIYLSVLFFFTVSPVYALFSRGYSCEVSELNFDALVRPLLCADIGVAEVDERAVCLGVFRFNNIDASYEKTSHFPVEDGLGCGSVHVSRTGKYVAVINSLFGREADKTGLRIYTANGVLVGAWEIQKFLSEEELGYPVKIGEGFLWFNSGGFDEEKETFTFTGPAKAYTTGTGTLRATRLPGKIGGYKFQINLVEKTISRQSE